MFYLINDNQLKEWGDRKFSDECKEIAGITMEEYNAEPYRLIISGDELIPNPDYEEEKARREAERVNNLTMTPLDFIKVLQAFGLTLEQVNTFLESNLNIKMQLTYCNSVYCGVVKSFLPITIDGIEITAAMVEEAFKRKGEE